MMQADDFLVEVGSEELPPKALHKLALAFQQHIVAGLQETQLPYAETAYFATPRRLAVWVKNLATVQPDREVERRGPAVKAAFSADNKPTPACEGFAKSCGVSVAELETVQTEKGEWLAHRYTQSGQTVDQLLPTIVTQALSRLPIPKRMRWGNYSTEFVRPVHWVVMLYGGRVIECDILGKTAGTQTYGHRFHHPQAIQLTAPADYAAQLYDACVIANFTERRQVIEQQIHQLTDADTAVIEPELLDEVTALVEWPQAMVANFESDFLQVPKEVLIAAMQDHQRCFPLTDTQGQLVPRFIAVANIASKQPQQIKEGNERVMRARLSDAAFFFTTDQKKSLGSRQEMTQHVVLQNQLGSLYDKGQRLQQLMVYLVKPMDLVDEHAVTAAQLAKCDLVTDMVNEFPELQGVMGYYYARHDQQPEAVALAIKEHYLPRFARDVLPESVLGTALSLADRIDHLVGIFGINQQPSGVKDPYKLRRSALGVIRLVLEKRLSVNLTDLLQQAQANYPQLPNQHAAQQVQDYILERLRHWYQEQDIASDVIQAVLVCQTGDLLDNFYRIQAVQAFRLLAEAEALVAANKRVHNILRKATEYVGDTQLRLELLQEPAESKLAMLIEDKRQTLAPLYQQAEYQAILSELADLREPIDQFFDDVMVMVDEPDVRQNRLALLAKLRHLFTQVADISLLQGI